MSDTGQSEGVQSESVRSEDGEQEWRRFHPLSPLIRGGLIAVAVIGSIISQQFDRLLGQSDGPAERAGRTVWFIIGGGILAVILVVMVVSWFSWRFSRFRLTPTLVEVRSGVLFRQHRQVRYDRIQAVDVTRPILARVFGLSEVVVQSAGGANGHLKMSFLSQPDALALRDQLSNLSTQHDHAPSSSAAPDTAMSGSPGNPSAGTDLNRAVQAGMRTVLQVPTARLIQAWALSPAAAIMVLAGTAALTGVVTGHPEVLAFVLPILFGAGGHKVKQLVTELNFKLEHDPAALRTQHGLTEVRATTVPLHRIQAVELQQHLWWRPFGWWRIIANVAGAESGGSDELLPSNVLLPVGTLPEALTVLGLVAPGLDAELATLATTGSGPAGGFVGSPPVARRFDPWSWRALGYAVTADLLVIRRGRFTREVQVVPHARVQSVTLEEGWAQRSAGLASVRIVSTLGQVSPRVHHLALADAEQLVIEQMARSTRARRSRSQQAR